MRRRYVAPDPNSDIIGDVVLSVRDALGDNILSILEEVGLAEVQAGEWYSFQAYLDIFNIIHENGENVRSVFVDIGMQAARHAVVSEEAYDIESMFMNIDTVYNMNHRGSDVGNIKVELIEPRYLKISDTTPYPRDYHYGVYYSFARAYRREGDNITLEYDGARDLEKAHDMIVYHLRW